MPTVRKGLTPLHAVTYDFNVRFLQASTGTVVIQYNNV